MVHLLRDESLFATAPAHCKKSRILESAVLKLGALSNLSARGGVRSIARRVHRDRDRSSRRTSI